jgi:capsular polysaccharide biosynthesis protein
VAAALRTSRRLIESRVRAYALLADSPQVLAPIAAAMRLPYPVGTLVDHVAATVPLNSTLIDIEVTDSDPIRGGTVLQAIVENLIAVADGEPHTADPASVLRISVRDPVSLPFRPAPDHWPLYVLAGFAAGLAVGVGLATARVVLAEREQTVGGWSAAGWSRARDRLRTAGRRVLARS